MAFWNPRRLLDVYPQQSGFTCVGTTREGRRCRQSFLKNTYKAEADRILDLLPTPEQYRTNHSDLYPTLRHLAWLTLCPRWHQNGTRCQADAIAAKWMRIIIDSVTGTPGYDGYQTPAIIPMPPPPSSDSNIRPVSGAALPFQARTFDANILPPSPQLSPTQRLPRSTGRYGDQASNTGNFPPQVSSSIRTTTRDGTVRIDLNVTVILNPPEPSDDRRGSANSLAAATLGTNDNHSRSFIASNSSITDRSSSRSGASSSSNNNRPISYRDVQTILSRLETLEIQAAQILHSNRARSSSSSRSSSGTSSRVVSNLGSPGGSTISELHLPPPIGQVGLFFSPPRSPPPIPHTGSLSISTDTEPSSPVVFVNTLSSSGSSSPSSPSSQGTPRSVLGAAGPVYPSARIQRRPITFDTECLICLDYIHSAADAVWCRGTCGQNVHIMCFDYWRTSQRENPILLCIYCRQPWVF